MRSVHITASREYDVLVERGLLSRCGELVKAATKAKKAVVIAGDIVYPLYGARVEQSLKAAGFEVLHYVLPHGSRPRPWKTTASCWNFCPGTTSPAPMCWWPWAAASPGT